MKHVILLLLSLALVVGGIIWWRHDVSHLREHGVVTQAVSVGAWKKTKGASVTYSSSLKFKDEAGQNHSLSTDGVIFEGTYVPIVYDPNNPNNAVLKSELSDFMWPGTWPGVLITFGVIWMIGVVIGILKRES